MITTNQGVVITVDAIATTWRVGVHQHPGVTNQTGGDKKDGKSRYLTGGYQR